MLGATAANFISSQPTLHFLPFCHFFAWNCEILKEKSCGQNIAAQNARNYPLLRHLFKMQVCVRWAHLPLNNTAADSLLTQRVACGTKFPPNQKNLCGTFLLQTAWMWKSSSNWMWNLHLEFEVGGKCLSTCSWRELQNTIQQNRSTFSDWGFPTKAAAAV